MCHVTRAPRLKALRQGGGRPCHDGGSRKALTRDAAPMGATPRRLLLLLLSSCLCAPGQPAPQCEAAYEAAVHQLRVGCVAAVHKRLAVAQAAVVTDNSFPTSFSATWSPRCEHCPLTWRRRRHTRQALRLQAPTSLARAAATGCAACAASSTSPGATSRRLLQMQQHYMATTAAASLRCRPASQGLPPHWLGYRPCWLPTPRLRL